MKLKIEDLKFVPQPLCLTTADKNQIEFDINFRTKHQQVMQA
jgi:hypothetical protein